MTMNRKHKKKCAITRNRKHKKKCAITIDKLMLGKDYY